MLQQVIKDIFGFESLRPQQQKAIDAVLSGKDCIVVMPTGGGKSLCYQAPALVGKGIGLVISPLIALMKDQVDALRERGIVSAFWNSSLSPDAVRDLIFELRSGLIKLLYVAPERFVSASFLALTKELQPSLIAIDEAHCVSEWGHDFRPDYRQLRILKELFPGVPRIALTASATPKVIEDISKALELQDPLLVLGSFDRSNLFYEVRPKSEPYKQILKYLKGDERGSGIIYCTSRKRVDEVASKLQEDGIAALPYHAGLSDKQRSQHHELFMKDKAQVIVATIAFGMGIDKSNIRFVIHHDLPKSLEAYYQETGRAGRDGAPSECILFFSHGDRFVIESFIEKIEDPQERDRCYQKISQMVSFSSYHKCRRKALLAYFGEKYPHEFCGACDICCAQVKGTDATEISYKVLSTIVRLKQRWGARMVMDVLRGSNTAKIREIHANTLPVYGIAQEESVEHLRNVIDALLRRGYLKKVDEQYPILQLTEKAQKALKEREPISLLLPIQPIKEKQTIRQKLMEYDETLFAALRDLRATLAGERNVPPYVIFNDATLQEMSYVLPLTEQELLNISGIGKYKADNYGKPFLEAIHQAVKERDLTPKQPLKTKR